MVCVFTPLLHVGTIEQAHATRGGASRLFASRKVSVDEDIEIVLIVISLTPPVEMHHARLSYQEAAYVLQPSL